MMFFIGFSQVLLYSCFSILVGYFVLNLVSTNRRPTIFIPHQIIFGGLILIPLVSFVPILPVLHFLQTNLSLFESIQVILTSYSMGLTWIIICLISIELFIVYYFIKDKLTKATTIFALIQLIILTGLVAWTSHATSLEPQIGFLSDFIHLLSMSFWVGTVLVISFFSKDYNNWLSFLKWYSPLAITSVMLLLISGLFLTNILVPNYFTGFSTNYGQGLILKHILLLPIFIFIFINGMLTKSRLKNRFYDPRLWTKVEAVLLLFICIITAFFSQQNPPSETLQMTNLSSLFKMLYPNSITSGMLPSFSWSLAGILFSIITLFCLLAILVIFKQNRSLIFVSICTIVSIISTYFAFISFIHFI